MVNGKISVTFYVKYFVMEQVNMNATGSLCGSSHSHKFPSAITVVKSGGTRSCKCRQVGYGK
jgi:hypothetical protein